MNEFRKKKKPLYESSHNQMYVPFHCASSKRKSNYTYLPNSVDTKKKPERELHMFVQYYFKSYVLYSFAFRNRVR